MQSPRSTTITRADSVLGQDKEEKEAVVQQSRHSCILDGNTSPRPDTPGHQKCSVSFDPESMGGVVLRKKKTLASTTERPWSFSDFLNVMSNALAQAGKRMSKVDDKASVEDEEDDYDDDVFCSPDTVMQKSKSASSGGRLNPKKIWRARSKSQPRNNGSGTACLWTPQGSGVWQAIGGRQVTLNDVTLFNLTEVEVTTLRQVALAKLQGMELGCTISIPKSSDDSEVDKPKRRALILKKRSLTTGFFEHGGKPKVEDASEQSRRSSGLVFGVPLSKCISYDRGCQRSASAPLRDVANLMSTRLKAGSASAEDITRERLIASRGFSGSQTSCNIPLDIESDERIYRKQDDGSFESLQWVCKSHSMSGLSILERLQDWPPLEGEVEVTPRVPEVINSCFKHLESYGLHRLGIFRVSSSKKRVRQLREDFDSGKEILLNKEHCPHDVATLIKEYFRDLPEPLLTRDLYAAFVATQKIRNRRHQLDALRHLVQLLPVANRDTLWILLKFLAKVAINAVDHRTDTGEWVAGNKMDSHNLATFFGPNILHMAKSGLSQGSEFQVESTKRAEERIEVIKVVRLMIDNHKELYEVSAAILDEVYHKLLRHNPEALGRLLLAKLPLEMDIDADTGSSACSETASVSHLPIDISMEVSAPLIISVHTTEGSGVSATTTCTTTTHTWERMISTTESLPDDTLITTATISHARDSSNDSLMTDRRQDRGSSVGREILSKSESVASRLFRRRDKSAVRGEENRDLRPQTSSDDSASKSEESARWFRKKGDKINKKDGGPAKNSESSNKKPKKDRLGKRDCESEGSGSSEQALARVSTGSDGGRSRSRPLMFQENVLEAPSAVSIVDIRKEHLHLPEGTSERRLSTPGMDSTVISASLTIKVPLSRSQTGPAIAFGQDRDTDIPFIEDIQPDPSDSQLAAATRQRYLEKRHRSSPFFQKKGTDKDQKTTSSSGSTSSTAAVAPVVRARQRVASTSAAEPAPLTTSASASAILGQRYARRSRETAPGKGTSAPTSPISVDDQSQSPAALTNQNASSVAGAAKQDSSGTPKPRRKTSTAKQETSGGSPGRRPSGNLQWQQQDTWKRWEIISSEHTEQETVV